MVDFFASGTSAVGVVVVLADADVAALRILVEFGDHGIGDDVDSANVTGTLAGSGGDGALAFGDGVPDIMQQLGVESTQARVDVGVQPDRLADDDGREHPVLDHGA